MTDRQTTLIVLRGPSGSGKSSVAKAIRATQGSRIALVEQDYFRRIVLKEKDIFNGLNIELIKRTVIFALDHSLHVLLEGIFDADRYGMMFEEIVRAHPENNFFFYFDISLEETFRRHQTKVNCHEFGETELRAWYKHRDFLSCVQEKIVPETSTLEETTGFILSACDLSKEN